MYVVAVPNRTSPPAILLRESFREDGKVKNRTLANLSYWPETKVELLKLLLKDEPLVPVSGDAFDIVESLPHGHVAAVLGTLLRVWRETPDTLLGEAIERLSSSLPVAEVPRTLVAQQALVDARLARGTPEDVPTILAMPWHYIPLYQR